MMSTNRALAPSTPSRASIVVRDSMEPVPSAMTPPASVEQPPATPLDQRRTPAYEVPMQHVITIEHGDDLSSWRTIHENVLCSHSRYMQQLSTRSELLREKYDHCTDLSNRLERIAVAGLTPDQFEARKLDVELLSLMGIIEQFPIQEYQKGIDKAVGACMDQQFTNKNYLHTEDRPKALKNFQALGLKNRLSFLNAEGALETAEAAWMYLQKVRSAETQKSRTNISKAWAHGRLRIRGTTERSVLTLVEWAYHPHLRDDGAEHLYNLWCLATRLKFDVLAAECMDRIFAKAKSSIDHAVSNGIPLRCLLDLSDDQNMPDSRISPDEFVTTVFRHVLSDESASTKLSDLVIQTMARGMDPELWSQLSPLMKPEVMRKLVNAMVSYRQVKEERDINEANTIKHESHADLCNVELQPTGSR